MAFNSDKEKEDYLNNFYSENYDREQAIAHFGYLTSNQRNKRTTIAHISKCYTNGVLGSLLKRVDPISYNLVDGTNV